MNPVTVSPELVEWAHIAGYALTREGSISAIFYVPGGESRYRIERSDDGWYSLTVASRGGSDRLVVRAAALDAIERHLVAVFGAVVRDAVGLPLLEKPCGTGDVAPGYSLDEMDPDGFRTLFDSEGKPLAKAQDAVRSLLVLVPLSHFMSLSLQQLADSFRSRDGAPLMSGASYATRQ
jgi:hypothetical protein